MPLAAAGKAAKDIAAADDDGDLRTGGNGFGDVAGEAFGDGHVDAEVALAHQGFAGELEQHSLIEQSGCSCPSRGSHDRLLVPPRLAGAPQAGRPL